jgi:hypothetical protein
MKQIRLILIMFFLVAACMNASADEKKGAQGNHPVDVAQEYAGEILGVPVPYQNYYFIKAGLMIFGNKWGAPLKNDQDMENAVWEQLMLSLVAFNENITVDQDEVDREVGKTLQAGGAVFNWKTEPQKYEAWVKEKTNLTGKVFEEEIRHLLQLQHLREKIVSMSNPVVTEAEARQKFLNESNSLSVELVEVESQNEAQSLYKSLMVDKRVWDAEQKKHPEDFKRPGFVSLEFLIDLWKIPQEACYAMLKKDAGTFFPPQPIYKGYAVFKVLEKQQADESFFAKSKESYFEKVRNIKKSEGLSAWIANLRKQANIKVYVKAQSNKDAQGTAKQ